MGRSTGLWTTDLFAYWLVLLLYGIMTDWVVIMYVAIYATLKLLMNFIKMLTL